MTSYREGKMSPIKMLETIAGICKTNGKIDWSAKSQGSPEVEFNFIANMIDAYVAEMDKGSEGANQDG